MAVWGYVPALCLLQVHRCISHAGHLLQQIPFFSEHVYLEPEAEGFSLPLGLHEWMSKE